MPLLLLVLLAFYFCHRFYSLFPLEGDTLLHIYGLVHRDLIQAGHNPYQWYYTDQIHAVQAYNPVVQAVAFLVSLVAPSASVVAQAMATQMISGAILLSLLVCAVYYFLRKVGRTKSGAFLGAVIASLTGFHLVGVWEFDLFYLLSYAAVPLLLVTFLSPYWRAGFVTAALVLGFSLMGSNVPLFYYLPFFLLIPFLVPHAPNRAAHWVRLVCLTLAGFGVAGAVIWKAALSLGESNRAQVSFLEPGTPPPLPVTDQLLTVFFRDWWSGNPWHYHERDLYLGLPVVVLCLLGLWTALRDAKVRQSPVTRVLLLCLTAAVVVLNLSSLPLLAQKAITEFYQLLSIRNPNRFFLLALLPVAYFASLGFDRRKRIPLLVSTLLATAVAAGLLPRITQDWFQLLPDQELAFVVSGGAGFVALLGLYFSRPLAIAGITLMYVFAPIQLTRYTRAYDGYSGRVTAAQFLGLAPNYGRAFAGAEEALRQPPDVLLPEETRMGHILDVQDLQGGYRNHFYAPFTGHRFAMTLLHDPASPRRVRELGEKLTPALLDLQNVCWILQNGRLTKRPTCLPEAFFATQWTKADAEDVAELAQASTAVLARKLWLACDDRDCPASFASSHREVKPEGIAPGLYQYRLGEGKDGLVFLSVPYRKEWRATLDGNPVSILRADHAFMAVPVTASGQQLEITLDTTSSLWGVVISFATIALLSVYLLLGRLTNLFEAFFKPSRV